MGKIRVGLIRVISFKDKKLADPHENLIEKYFPDLQIISKCIKDQPKGIYDEETKKIAIPKIVELGSQIEEEEKVKAIIVSCADDPGVKELRKLLKIPVIGAGSSVAALSLSYGDKVGTFGITEQAPPIMREILGKHLVAETKPEGIKTTLDLMTDEGKRKALESIKYLKEKGAKVIALACTGYSTIGIANDLEKEVGIPVLDAVIAAGLFAWHFTRGSI
ncbi:hypothetical protein ES708_13063 [subsurface metagenome]